MSAEDPIPRRVQVKELLSWLSRTDRAAIVGIAAVAAAIAMVRHGTVQSLGLGLLGAFAAAIFLIDRRYRLIPDLLSLPLVPLGLLVSSFGAADLVWQIAERGLTAGAMWAGMYFLRWALTRQSGAAAMGGGDIKLIIAATAWLDLSSLPAFVLAAALSGLVEAWLSKSKGLAFGCHLAPWLWIFAFLQ